VVSGANSGIGLATATALARAGARVVLACRNPAKASAAERTIDASGIRGSVEVLRLDLADQSQIADAAAEAVERFGVVDGLINNAGVMALPHSRTVDGYETVFGTNHLGHFAFTGRILATLLAAEHARVVTVSSMSYRAGTIRWGDLDGERSYGKARAYAQSKLANLLFALELQRRLEGAGSRAISLAAHPGFASTEIGGTVLERSPRWGPRLRAVGDRLLPSPADAARPSLRAATAPDARGGELYGPGGLGGFRGAPDAVRPARRARDVAAMARLWDRSVELTGVEYAFG
jgi:NAD(P)-dependent dehydrogenase (short-subunit alcohol dehydrogenase family)